MYSTFTPSLTYSELEEMGVTLFENPPPMPSAPPPPPPPMQEEDQLNLVARSLKHPTLPPQIKLTTNNFDQHISKFLKTAVVFCVKCKWKNVVVFVVMVTTMFLLQGVYAARYFSIM